MDTTFRTPLCHRRRDTLPLADPRPCLREVLVSYKSFDNSLPRGEISVRPAIAFAATMFVIPLLSAQAIVTGSNANGRYWNTLSADSKTAYMTGLVEGMSELSSYVPKDCSCISVATVNMIRAIGGGHNSSSLEVRQSLDVFYQEPANRSVPIVKGLVYVTLKMKGASTIELEDLVANLRKAANP